MEPLMTPGRHFNMSILAEGVCVCVGGGHGWEVTHILVEGACNMSTNPNRLTD